MGATYGCRAGVLLMGVERSSPIRSRVPNSPTQLPTEMLTAFAPVNLRQHHNTTEEDIAAEVSIFTITPIL